MKFARCNGQNVVLSFSLINILRLLYLLKFYLPLILPEEQMDFKLSNIPGNSVYINYKAIKDRHGSGVLKLIRSLISQGKRIARHRAHLFFNHSCLRENILTKSLVIKSPINTSAGKKLAEKFGFNCLKLRINESHFWIRNSLRFMENVRGKLLKNSVIDFESILKHVEFTANKLYNTLMKHYDDKIAKLKEDFK